MPDSQHVNRKPKEQVTQNRLISMDEVIGATSTGGRETGLPVQREGDVRHNDTLTILVVDDEPDLELLIRQRFRRAIRSGHYHFLFARDGIEALARLAEDRHVDLVLSDINMPHMDGLRLLAEIAALERLLKVVIVSAYGDMSNIRTAMNRGAFDFVTKPIDFVDLEATIDKARRELNAVRSAFSSREELTAIQRELEIASRIQLSSLPTTFPAFPDRNEFDIYATMIPAREVGGDFYDFFLIDDDRLGFSLGDVSGKGIGAAFFMAVTQTMLRATALQGLPPEVCVTHVNRVLYPVSTSNMFVTLVYGVLDLTSGALDYVAAGHQPPYLLRGGSVMELERTGGIGLCLVSDFAFEARRARLERGDSLVLFTDGVTEAKDAARDLFSERRLTDCLGRSNGATAAEQVRDVLRAVDAFTDGAVQADDITLLSLTYMGA